MDSSPRYNSFRIYRGYDSKAIVIIISRYYTCII